MKRFGVRMPVRYYGGGLALLALVGIALFVVLPAFAFNVGDSEPPASGTYGITPTLVANGGQNNDCEIFYGVGGNGDGTYTVNGTTFHEFYVNNPKNTTSATDPTTGATFTLSVNNHTNVVTSWSATGAAVTDVGIKGGTQTLRYNYNGATPQPVTGDTSLHPPINGAAPNYYTVSHMGFCYTATATVSGTAFTDSNGDQNKQSGEAGINGLAVTIKNGANTVGSGSTNSSGAYSISVPQGGPYTVCIQQPSNTNETVPVSGTTNSAACTGSGIAGYGYTTTVGSSNVSGLNFGFQPAVSGTAFTDSNGDQIQQAGEAGISGLAVTILNGTTTVGTGSTASDGSYSIGVPAGGPYTVCIAQPSNTNETVPTSTACASGAPFGYSRTITSSGVSGLNFGFQPTVSGTAFTDSNGDGSQSGATETGISGQTVTIKSGSTTVGTGQTNSSGGYSIGVPVGGPYTVCITQPSNTNETVPTSTSCAGGAPHGYSSTVIAPGGVNNLNFGFQPTVSGTAFMDSNANQAQDSGESGISGLAVTIKNGATTVGQGTTNSSGDYSIGVPVGGPYTVCVAQPSNTNETLPTSTTGNSTSCASGAQYGYSRSVAAPSGVSSLNFGFQPTVSGTAFTDSNGSGTQQAGESGISGLAVTILNGTTTVASGSTASDGSYSIAVPAGGPYTVCITQPSNTKETVPTSTSCAGGAPYGYSTGTITSSGVSGLNFGFQPVGSVSGTVYQDVNGYNTQNPPQLTGQPDGHFQSALDTPLALWSVTLYDGSNNVVGTTTSNNSGQYSLPSIAFDPSQTYRVCVAPAPPGGTFGQSEPLPTSTDNCSTPALLKGQTFKPSSSGDNVTENFGVDPSVAPTPCDPPSPFGVDFTGDTPPGNELMIQLAACKPNQTFVFNSGILPDGTTPFVSVWASDQTLTQIVPLVEHIVFPDPIDPDKAGGGAPRYTGLSYTDTFPYDPSVAEPMPTCKVDPRDPSDPSGMSLPSGFTDSMLHSNVLPATNPGTSTPATSCVLSVRTYVDASGKTWLDAYAVTDIDGFTKPH